MTRISTREAARRLQPLGLTRRRVDRVLAVGLAGEPERAAGVTWWDAERVHELATRRALAPADLDDACPQGLFVARRDVNVRTSGAERLDAVRGGWDLSVYTRVWIRATVRQHGHLPLVASVSGFVVLGAEVVGVRADRVREGVVSSLELRAAGAWFDNLSGCRLATGPGRPWVIRGWQPLTALTRRGVPRPAT